MRIQIIFTAVVQKIEKRWQLRCKNTQHVGRQYTQNAQILTKQKNEGNNKRTNKTKKNKQTKNTLHNDVLRKSEKRRRGNYYL